MTLQNFDNIHISVQQVNNKKGLIYEIIILQTGRIFSFFYILYNISNIQFLIFYLYENCKILASIYYFTTVWRLKTWFGITTVYVSRIINMQKDTGYFWILSCLLLFGVIILHWNKYKGIQIMRRVLIQIKFQYL